MEHMWQWGIDVIISVQTIRSPFFDSFFTIISFFGTMVFYLLFLPVLYWCFDKKYAARIFFLFIISSWFNTILKDLFNHPRPYSLNETVKIGKTGGPGLPSGHAQQSFVVWGSVSLWLKNRVFSYLAVFIILIIAFSRIYLGVHFPTDIFAGWLIAAVILIVMWPLFDRIESFLPGMNALMMAAASVIIPAVLSFIMASKTSVMSMGALSGFCAGIMIERRYINFSKSSGLRNGILRYIAGGVLLLLLFSAEKFLFSKDSSFYLISVFIHSWILSIWVFAGAPWLFKKIRL